MRRSYVNVLVIMVMLLIVSPTTSIAASSQLSATAQTSLDRMISDAKSDVANNLRIQINTLRALQEKEQASDIKIKTIHYQNEEQLIVVRKLIKLIDADKISKLDSQVKNTKSRYTPLFDSYTLLNQKIEIAKKLKNKPLNSVLKSQSDTMKVAVQLARTDIRNKENELKKAKANQTKTTKALRATLSKIDPIKVKIKSERSLMRNTKQRFTSEWKTLNAAIKKSDSKSVLKSLTSLVSISIKMNDHMETIHKHEKSIKDTIQAVQSQIP